MNETKVIRQAIREGRICPDTFRPEWTQAIRFIYAAERAAQGIHDPDYADTPGLAQQIRRAGLYGLHEHPRRNAGLDSSELPFPRIRGIE